MVGTQDETRGRTKLASIDVATLLASRDAIVVDLRTPSEHAEDHLPGAHNVPLFDDVERALVGTLYRQSSPAAAFAEGHRYVRAHVAGLVARIAEIAGRGVGGTSIEDQVDRLCARGLEGLAATLVEEPADALPPGAVVFHCWRGGLRSRSVVALLERLGFERAFLLSGGHKAYRRRVVAELAAWNAPPTVVLRGWTGVGKTLVLREIEALRPGTTVDLEALAGHRSSLLGMVGLEPRSQKAFESGLAARLREIDASSPIVIEGESRKVGDAILPASVWRAIDGGTNVELVASVERRIEVLAEDYLAAPGARVELARQLPLIEARMDRATGSESLCSLLARDAIDELVRILLEEYYDPLYRHSERGRRYAARVDATDPARAARAIVDAFVAPGVGAGG